MKNYPILWSFLGVKLNCQDACTLFVMFEICMSVRKWSPLTIMIYFSIPSCAWLAFQSSLQQVRSKFCLGLKILTINSFLSVGSISNFQKLFDLHHIKELKELSHQVSSVSTKAPGGIDVLKVDINEWKREQRERGGKYKDTYVKGEKMKSAGKIKL